jgi:hypothetical protein
MMPKQALGFPLEIHWPNPIHVSPALYDVLSANKQIDD